MKPPRTPWHWHVLYERLTARYRWHYWRCDHPHYDDGVARLEALLRCAEEAMRSPPNPQ